MSHVSILGSSLIISLLLSVRDCEAQRLSKMVSRPSTQRFGMVSMSSWLLLLDAVTTPACSMTAIQKSNTAGLIKAHKTSVPVSKDGSDQVMHCTSRATTTEMERWRTLGIIDIFDIKHPVYFSKGICWHRQRKVHKLSYFIC